MMDDNVKYKIELAGTQRGLCKALRATQRFVAKAVGSSY